MRTIGCSVRRPVGKAGVSEVCAAERERNALSSACIGDFVDTTAARTALSLRSQQPEASRMTRFKDFIDQEKPVFDYLNYALRLAAWGIGLAVAFEINRANPDPFSHAVNLAAIGTCTALGLFALARFAIMNARMAESLTSDIASRWLGRVAAIVAVIWPVLAVTFVGMLICSTLMAAVGPR
jgi:hypothetical protein